MLRLTGLGRIITPAKAGVQKVFSLDSGWNLSSRGRRDRNDGIGHFLTFYRIIITG